VSPLINFPAGSDIGLNFYASYGYGTGDFGAILVSTDNTCSTFTQTGLSVSNWAIAPPPSSGPYKLQRYDLSTLAGTQRCFAFYFQSNADASLGPGLYIDDVKINVLPAKSPVISEDWETGYTDFCDDTGFWSVFNADGDFNSWFYLATDPSPGHSVPNVCWWTDGSDTIYNPGMTDWIITTNPIDLTSSTFLRLNFNQQFDFGTGDSGQILVRADPNLTGQCSGTFRIIYTAASGSNWGTYSPATFDFSQFWGTKVCLAFRTFTNTDASVSQGWVLDDIKLMGNN